MKRRTLFAVALSGILLRTSEVLGIEGETPRAESPEEIRQCLFQYRYDQAAPNGICYRVLSGRGEVLFEGEEACEVFKARSNRGVAWCWVAYPNLNEWQQISFDS